MVARTKSPKAPAMSLSEAVDKVFLVYEKERCLPVSTDVVAKDLGYKDSRSGAASKALAAIKGFGLLDTPKFGHLAVSKDLESFKFNPNPDERKVILIEWLKTPKIYAEILEKFPEHLPSDNALIFELIKMGFGEGTAKSFLSNFKDSINYASYYEELSDGKPVEDNVTDIGVQRTNVDVMGSTHHSESKAVSLTLDRIPVRLSGARRAWLEIPMPFYEKDKEVIKKQIDLIFTDEEEND